MEIKNNKPFDAKIDYGILAPVFILVLIGLLSVYVALNHDPQKNISLVLVRQMAWILISLLSVVITINLDSKILWKMTFPAYLAGLGLMVLPIFFYNPDLVLATGAKNWVSFGGQAIFQPSEMMKIFYILFLSLVLTSHNTKYTVRSVKTDFLLIGKMLLTTLPIVILLKKQDDLGTMLVFLAIFCGMALVSGITWKIIIPIVSLIVIIVGVFIYLLTNDVGREILQKLQIMHQYQFNRLDAWLNPFNDPSGNSFQQAQGLLAIGSGGLTGKGFNQSDLVVPVRESDMIFTVIGENFGFIGSTFVVLLYFILIYRMFKVTYEANNQFYTFIACGIVMMILFHVFENIGANIGLLPLTGIPLPFISQGGSSMLSNFLGIGLILSMYYHKGQEY